MAKTKTTKDDFTTFCHECTFWLEKLGLLNYEIDFRHAKIENLAMCAYDDQGRQATLTLGVDWGAENPITEETVRHAAFHEVWELFFGRVRNMCNDFHAADRTDREIHKLITTIQNVFFEE